MGDQDDKRSSIEVEGRSTQEILTQIDLFAGLPSAHLMRVVDIGLQEQHAGNATIFTEHDPGHTFYLILEGAVRISRFVPGMGEEALAVLRPGAYFGERSLIDDSPRSAPPPSSATNAAGCSSSTAETSRTGSSSTATSPTSSCGTGSARCRAASARPTTSSRSWPPPRSSE